MITLRKAEDRGNSDFGWLQSKHSFSFHKYQDNDHMGFSELLVINDDEVLAGAGFDMHGHRDVEIISYVFEGTMEHKDSTGNIKVLPAGEFQLMSAGKGIFHSEYNASKTDRLKFLQIWIKPNVYGERPGYQQKDFGKSYGLTTIATPNGEAGTLRIKQKAKLHQLIVKAGTGHTFTASCGTKVYLHQVNGQVQLNDLELTQGDGAKLVNETSLTLHNRTEQDASLLVFELP